MTNENTTDNTLPPGVPPAGNPPVVPPTVTVPVVPVVNPVTPVTAPATVPAEAPKETAASNDLPESYTGNATLDVAIHAFAQTTGASTDDLQRAVSNALQYGDESLIDVAFITEKFGKHAPQALALAKAAVADINQQHAQAKQAVYATAGGEQNWNQAVSVFNTSAPEHVKVAVQTLVNSGRIQEGAQLLLDVVKGSGLLPQVNPTLTGGAATAPAGGALDAASFRKEMEALKKEAGNRSLESGVFGQRYQVLIQRRAAGRQIGL